MISNVKVRESSSGVQMLVEPAHFLLLVPVAVFLPRLAHRHLGHSFAWAHWPAAWLVAHHRLDPFGERPHVLLTREIPSKVKHSMT